MMMADTKRTKKTLAVRLSKSEQELVDAALSVRKNAYAPYSRFKVGAALKTDSGDLFTGCNVENASYGATVCAERHAVGCAVAQGQTEFVQLAIATSTSPPSAPCGICRQVLGEFAPKLKILLVNTSGEVLRTRLDKLLPLAFSKKDL